MTPADPHRTRDPAWLALALLALLAWEAGGGDRALSAWAGGSAGFPLRVPGSWASVLHEAGRGLAAWVLAALLLDAAWPQLAGRRPVAARERWTRRAVALATVGTLLAVPAIKRISLTSCPWDVVDFGGQVPWVSHWAWSVLDGGPGHCFPSGHAVAAFAFYVPALAWRRSRPRAATAAFAGVSLAGAVFGATQLLRGAHYLSHVLWSAWLCAVIAVGVSAVILRPASSGGLQPRGLSSEPSALVPPDRGT
jgi:membrane-associated PAP2 superfamily phosphatase